MSGRRTHHSDQSSAALRVAAARSESHEHATNRIVPRFGTRVLHVFQGTQFDYRSTTLRYLSDPTLALPTMRQSDKGHVKGYVPVFRRLGKLALTPDPNAVADGDDGPSVVTFHNERAGVSYEIHFGNTLGAFRRALATPDVGVVYMGHARNGRGPCFGAGNNGHGEHWNEGDGSNTGIFRMGRRWIGVPAKDIVENAYSTGGVATLAQHFIRRPTQLRGRYAEDELIHYQDCDQDIRDHFAAVAENEGAERPKTLGTLNPNASAQVTNVSSNEPVHSFVGAHHGEPADCLLIEAGAADLRRMTVECRFFAHLGCSSGPHNAAVFRAHAPLSSGKPYAVFTTAPASFYGWLVFLHHLLLGPVRAADDWLSPLQHAVEELTRAQALARPRQRWQAYLA